MKFPRAIKVLLRKLGIIDKTAKLSGREVRFLLYALIAFFTFVAWNVTEHHASQVREIEDFAEHRRSVGESNLPPLPEPVVENITETTDFGDEEHVIVIDLRPEDPTHDYLDPTAKSNMKNIVEALKNEGRGNEVVQGSFRGQYISHMGLAYRGQKHKKQRTRATISDIRANPHKKKSTRHPYARGHTNDIIYYQSKKG